MGRSNVEVYLERGGKRTFAVAADWPGWARAGRSADEALAALIDYGNRYAVVPRRARIAFTQPSDVSALTVIETLPGTPTTDFGAPGVPLSSDARAMKDPELKRLIKLHVASWKPSTTWRGRREECTFAWARAGVVAAWRRLSSTYSEPRRRTWEGLGARPPKSVLGDPSGSMKRLREAMLAALTAVVHGEPVADPRNTKKPWSPRFAIRRSAWHALDHAWEIEDRST